MERNAYVHLMEFWRRHPACRKVLIVVCQGTPYLLMAMYGAVVIYLAISHPRGLILTLSIPAVTLVLVSLLRRFLNRPRPFETLDFEPLIRHSSGKSFPSRHTASAFILAMSFFSVHLWLGMVGLFFAVVVAATRILTGVHYLRDVGAGAAISILLGGLGFFLLPLVPFFQI